MPAREMVVPNLARVKTATGDKGLVVTRRQALYEAERVSEIEKKNPKEQ